MAASGFRIRPARSAADLHATVVLFKAYAASLAVDLAFQGFAAELAAMPGQYAPPGGSLLLARGAGGAPLGCVGVRPLPQAERCEMKRLYVAPQARGLGVGRALVEAIIGVATQIGYREMRLDTLPSMARAIVLYTEAGFAPIEPYYDSPLPGTLFLARLLGAPIGCGAWRG